MKDKVIKILLGIMLILFVPVTSFAADNSCGDNLEWKIENGTLIISGSGDMADWETTSQVPWYSQRENIRAAVIEEGVTSIGKSAFEGLGNMANIQLPDSIEKIGERAFCQCFGLKNINIPQKIKIIDNNTFCWCRNLTSIVIPDGVVSIGKSAFAQCQSLTDITIPNTVTDIGQSAFGECYKLVNVDYTGSQKEWENIKTEDSNDYLTDAQIHFLNPYSVLIYTTPYAKVTINDNVYYSDGNGIVRFESNGKISYTIEKGGYETISVNETEVPEEGKLINVLLSMNDDTLYTEDFETVSNSAVEVDLSKCETSNKLFGMTAGYGDIKLNIDGGMFTAVNTAKNDFRSVSYPVNVNSADTKVIMNVIFPENAESHIVLRDSANQVLGAIHRAADGTATFGASGRNFAGTETVGIQDSPLGIIAAGKIVTISIGIDTTNGKMIAIVGDRTAGVGNYTKTESGFNDIASIYVGTDCGSEIKIDDIVIKNYADTSAKIAEFTINTTPYAKATINGGIYYSGASGKITAEYVATSDDAVCNIEYTIEKDGYITKSETVSATSAGLEIDAMLDLETGILYSEHFNTVSADNCETELLGGDYANSLFGIYAQYGTVKLISDNEKLSISHNGNGFRSISYPMNIDEVNLDLSFDVSFPDEETNIVLRDSENQIIGAIHRSAEGEVTFGASGMVFNTYNGGVGVQAKSLGNIESNSTVTVNIKFDMENGIVTAVMGENKASVNGYKKSVASNGISSIFVGKGRGSGVITLDNIIVREYVGTTEPITKIKINTTPYAKITVADEVYYSGADGIIEMSCVMDNDDGKTVLYKAEKNGYKTKEGNAEKTLSGIVIDAVLELNDGVVYWEDFDTVSESPIILPLEAKTTADKLFDIYAEYGTINLNADTQKLSIGNNGGGFRSISYPINVNTKNAQLSVDVAFPANADSHLLLRDKNNKILGAIYRAADGETTFAATGSTFSKANTPIGQLEYSLGNVAADTAVTVTFKFDEINKQVTASIGDKSATAVLSMWADEISTLFIGTARGKTLSIDNLIVKDYTYKDDSTQKPEITAIKLIKYENGKAFVSVDVAENDEINLNIYVAEYNYDDLVGVKKVQKTLSASEDIYVDYEKLSEQNSIAVYVWDNDMAPYCEAFKK